MSALRLVRIDYVQAGTMCQSGCRHELEMAHVVRNTEGVELFYGSKCITDVFPAAELKKLRASVPDLTLRGCVAASGGSKVGGSTDGGEPRNVLQKRAAEYLWLRLDKVATLCPERAVALRWSPLCEKFEQLKLTGLLSDSDAEMILATEKSERTPPEFRRLNLMDVYSAACQLERKLKKKPNDFLESVLRQLTAKLRLSKLQLEKAKLELPATAFAWYVPPANA